MVDITTTTSMKNKRTVLDMNKILVYYIQKNERRFLFVRLSFVFYLDPGILVVLPKNGKKMMVAGVHALIFAAVFTLTHPWIMKNTHFMFEGFSKESGSESEYNKSFGKDKDNAHKIMNKKIKK